MQKLVLSSIWLLFLFYSLLGYSQKLTRSLEKRVLVKTNLFSLIAQKPTFSLEKIFKRGYSAEISFVQGEFNFFFFTDHYQYQGFLIRTKKYLGDMEFSKLNPYMAVYTGTLKRTIQTEGQSNNAGWFGFSTRNFSSNSIRGGGSFGLAYFSKSKIVLDGQTSLGYGRYIHLNQANPNTYAKGYLDMQVWLSVGYAF
ncbi:hypothetical protein [Adhaeribacter radiodurans]|uniref:DUF3575 domain-containing protein n=1 Tax=Adhaeribacter radiodurans TaxID=2745197 RepID=A0A7L7L6C0_9BACT|nr:hypothetical protein [Adhaeribacter radiodurans]QMU28055.1 hypothetical protein HUW48_08345 [Adhaeribacter radiodurans]